MYTEMVPPGSRLGLGFSKLGRMMHSFEALHAHPSHSMGPYNASQFHRWFFVLKRHNQLNQFNPISFRTHIRK